VKMPPATTGAEVDTGAYTYSSSAASASAFFAAWA
jgi:hypothetical protein